jgi:3-oxoadipate enol-lactonase
MLSNSLGTDLSMWDAQVPTLARDFRVLRYDTRGHGGSDATPGPYTIERLGRDATGLLDGLGIDAAHFCGLSLGGVVGMWIGVNAPARIARLALCNTAPKIGTPESWNARIDAVRKGGMAAIASTIIERWFTARFRESAPAAAMSAQRTLETISPEGYVACCAAVRDMDLRDEIALIRAPTLVIAGTHDVPTPAADGRQVAARIPDARYVELPAAHLSNIEAADAFTAAIAEFFTD